MAGHLAPIAAAACALLSAAPAGSQTAIPLSTDRAPVLIRFSTPSPPLESRASREPGAPPSGEIVNGGSRAVRVVVFVQRPVGFESGVVLVHGIDGGFRVAVDGTGALVGGRDRPIWCTGVVAPGGRAALETWGVADPDGVAPLLAEGRVQIGLLALTPRGPIDAALDGFSMGGPEAPGTASGDLVFPRPGFLTGTHDLPDRCFSTPPAGLDACVSSP